VRIYCQSDKTLTPQAIELCQPLPADAKKRSLKALLLFFSHQVLCDLSRFQTPTHHPPPPLFSAFSYSCFGIFFFGAKHFFKEFHSNIKTYRYLSY
jgi:hypothetical protein